MNTDYYSISETYVARSSSIQEGSIVKLWKWQHQTDEFTLSGMFAATRNQIVDISGKVHRFDHYQFMFRTPDINAHWSCNTFIREVQYSEAHVQWFIDYVGRVGIDLFQGNSLH